MKYVASPYTHPSAAVRNERATTAENFAASYAHRGIVLYCPIAAWHNVATRCNLPTNAQFWHKTNIAFLRLASELWVLMIEGWDESAGVDMEIRFAKILGIPIRYFSEDNFAEVALQAYTKEKEAVIKGVREY